MLNFKCPSSIQHLKKPPVQRRNMLQKTAVRIHLTAQAPDVKSGD